MNHKALLFLPFFCAAACGHADDGHVHDENEVITTVVLTFAPESGTPIVATFDDPDGDGGEAPTVDDIVLSPGTYDVAVGFENRLETPPEIITDEVADEAEQHLVFFTGSAVNGPTADNAGAPLEHGYADQDLNNLPIGLENTVVAALGSGELVITLRHMPPLGDAVTKTGDVPMTVRESGFGAVGGGSDAQVTFSVSVE
ncbi:MAG: hypothetical protein GY811_02215 [Myxococcales bacterium]|nr:hypothetical protein [Myxococcales bacterium]